MVTEKLVTIDNKNFKLLMDFDKIEHGIEYETREWNKGSFIHPSDDKHVTEEEYMGDIAKMRADLEKLKNDDNFLREIAYHIGKKKNGFFRKGAVHYAAQYENTMYLSEEEYGFRGDCLKAKAIDAQTAEIFFTSDILYKW